MAAGGEGCGGGGEVERAIFTINHHNFSQNTFVDS
jgi:hypothetical protein